MNPLLLSLDIHRVLDGFARQPTSAEFRFDPESPLIVTLKLTVEQGVSVTWRISRELLHTGLHAVSGSGDVRVWPARSGDRDMAWLLLDGRDMSALFELPIPPVEHWLKEISRIMPPEADTDGLDWDAFLAEVLDAPGPPSGTHR
ncbi:SsgA family sporulation/cell division regulator [Streptomyces sp. ME01-24h]|nr:SsgA family sporulation/cell division regulator [Streptomyces sp. ME19-03-3]MDX3354053.1 SsgA family sporulation/cell division regulator [Streptomyces sp. ME01-24h]